MERHPARGTLRAPEVAIVSPRLGCNASGCSEPGDEMNDVYGIYAGRWCFAHRSLAPGQFEYAGPDTEPLDEDRPNPVRREDR